ncbi:unnamed protein product, partial [Cladocopium goreaui]
MSHDSFEAFEVESTFSEDDDENSLGAVVATLRSWTSSVLASENSQALAGAPVFGGCKQEQSLHQQSHPSQSGAEQNDRYAPIRRTYGLRSGSGALKEVAEKEHVETETIAATHEEEVKYQAAPSDVEASDLSTLLSTVEGALRYFQTQMQSFLLQYKEMALRSTFLEPMKFSCAKRAQSCEDSE